MYKRVLAAIAEDCPEVMQAALAEVDAAAAAGGGSQAGQQDDAHGGAESNDDSD